MAYGDLSLANDLYMPSNSGINTKWIQGNGDYWLQFMADLTSDTVILRTRRMNPINAFGAVVDTYQFVDATYETPLLESLYDGVIGMWGREGLSIMFRAILIDSSGNISLGPEITVATTDVSQGTPGSAVNIGGTNWAVTHASFVGAAWASFMTTMSISATGAALPIYTKNTGYAASGGGQLIHVSGSIYAERWGMTVATHDIDASGASITQVDLNTFSYGFANSGLSFAKYQNGWWILEGRGKPGATYYTYGGSFQITDEGLIDDSFTHVLQLNSGNYGVAEILYLNTDSSLNSYWASNILGSGSDMYIATGKVDISGTITNLASIEWYPATIYYSGIHKLGYTPAGNVISVVVRGDNDGFTGTSEAHIYDIDVQPPAEISDSTPATGRISRTYDIVITGTNLDACTSADFGAGVTINGFAVINSTTIHVTITIDADAVAGYRDVFVDDPNGGDTISNGFYVYTTENHYFGSYPKVNLPYVDEDETKELHMTLTNLSATEKTALEEGEVIVEISYKVES